MKTIKSKNETLSKKPASAIEKGIYRRFEWAGSGRFIRLRDLIPAWAREMFERGVELGLVERGNNAPRGGKIGEFYKLKRPLTKLALKRAANRQARAEAAERARLEKELAKVLPSYQVDGMAVNSDVGSIRISLDGGEPELLNNFMGDGEVFVKICRVSREIDVESYPFITRRQVYSPESPLIIRRFERPHKLRIWYSDIGGDGEYRDFSGVVAFAVWEGKMKIIII